MHVVNTSLVDVPGVELPGPEEMGADEVFTVVVRGVVNCGPGYMDRGKRVMINCRDALKKEDVKGIKKAEGWWVGEIDGSGW